MSMPPKTFRTGIIMTVAVAAESRAVCIIRATIFRPAVGRTALIIIAAVPLRSGKVDGRGDDRLISDNGGD